MTMRKIKRKESGGRPRIMTDAQIKSIVESAVLETLGNIGIRAKTDEEVDALRQDFAYTRAWRTAIQKGSRMGFMSMLTILIGGTLSAVALGLKVWFGH